MIEKWRYWKAEEEKSKWHLILDSPKTIRSAVDLGAMFVTWASVSEPIVGNNGHPEPIRYGDLHLDFDHAERPEKALQDLRELALVHLPELFDVDPYAISFFASGKKGFHATLPAKLFDSQDGDQLLPLIYKRMVAGWAEQFNLKTIDHSLYAMRKGKMLRLPNVKRRNGNFKIPLTLEEVRDLSIGEIQKLQTRRRKIDPVEFDLIENIELEAVFRNTRAEINEDLKKRPPTKTLTKAAKNQITKGLPPCIAYILKESPKTEKSNFNTLVMNLVCWFKMAGYRKSDAWNVAHSFVENYPFSGTYRTLEQRTEHWNKEWNYLQENDSYSFDCSYVRGLGFPGSAFECADCLRKDETQVDSKKIFESLNRNEDGDATLYIELFKNRFCFDHSSGTWFEFEGNYWVEDGIDQASASIDGVVNLYSGEAKAQADQRIKAEMTKLSDQAKKHASTESALLKRIRLLQTTARKKNVLIGARTGRGSLGVTGAEWDKKLMLLPCLNGIVDLRTGDFRPGNPTDFIKTVAPENWAGTHAPAPTWEKTLDGIFGGDPEIISFVQRLFGYGLTGCASEDKYPIFWGAGRNGKTTITEIIAHALGDLAGPLESEMLLVQRFAKNSGGPTSDIMALRGKRIVWASEIGQGRTLNVGKLKWLTGGDTLVGRQPYGKRQVAFIPTHTLILLTNHKPRIASNDFAIWQRVLLVPFEIAFVDNPTGPNERKAEPDLLEQLKTEGPGILAWLVRGCLEYQEKGLNPPAAVTAATTEYQKDEDVIGNYLGERCELDPHSRVKAGVLFKDYRAWCEESSLKPLTATAFGTDIKTRFDSEKSTYVYYIGLSIREDTDTSEGSEGWSQVIFAV